MFQAFKVNTYAEQNYKRNTFVFAPIFHELKISWNRPFVYIEKVLDLWVQLMKNGGKTKSVAFIILFSVYTLHLAIKLIYNCRKS